MKTTTPDKVEIYGAAISQPTRAVIWLCEMRNIPYKHIEVNVVTSRKSRADYIKNINPNGRIPSIKDTNGVILYESGAILSYLCDRYGITNLYPTDPKIRAKINEYMHWHHENIRYATTAYVGLIMRIDVPLKQWILGTDNLERRQRFIFALDIIENKRLKDNKYIVGNSLSIADILCYAELVQLDVWDLLGGGTNLGFDLDGTKYMKTNYPNIFQWMLRMRKLPKHATAHAMMIHPMMLKHVAQRQVKITAAMKKYRPKL